MSPVKGMGPQCSHEGCNKPAHRGGICAAHWHLTSAFNPAALPTEANEIASLSICEAIWVAS